MEQKKRIAVFLPTLGINNRGSETYVMELTNYLSRYYDFDIYSLGTDSSVKSNIIQVKCEKGRLLSWYEKYYRQSKRLIWLLNRTRWALPLQPGYFFKKKFHRYVYQKYVKHQHYDAMLPVSGVFAAVWYRRKHNIPFFFKGGAGVGPGDWWVLKKRPDMYIAISSAQERWARKYWGKVCMIPNGISLERFAGKEKGRYAINPGHRLVISAGHLDTNFKRHQLAIEALSVLPDTDLLILGSGEAKEYFQRLGNAKMAGRLEIKSVHYTEMPFYYKSADVFTLPSIREPFGIVYIEAMACGLPVVATDDEVRREIIGDAGILCNVENAEEYAAAIRQALDREWGDIPLRRAHRYSYDVVGEEYHRLIEELMAKRPYKE